MPYPALLQTLPKISEHYQDLARKIFLSAFAVYVLNIKVLKYSVLGFSE